jgi:GAF domain-containing protein
VLGQLQRITASDLQEALTQAAQAVAEAFGVDKTDIFLLDPATSSLVALGTSRTPMGQQQRALGLHILPLANGGRMVQVFQAQQPYRDGQVDQDPEELRGVKVELGVRSTLAVPLLIADQPRGVLQLCDARPERFSERDQQLLEFVAHWVGLMALRFEPRPA